MWKPTVKWTFVILLVMTLSGGLLWRIYVVTPTQLVVRPSPTNSKPNSDWSSVLALLDTRLVHAYLLRDPSLLDGVDAPSSPALAADTKVIQRLVAADATVKDLSFSVIAAAELSLRWSAQRQFVRVRVTDSRSRYTETVAGQQPIEVAERGSKAWVITLFRAKETDPWLVWSNDQSSTELQQ